MKLKICGLKFSDNIVAVAQLQPDYLGFIFYEKSSRFFKERLPNNLNSIKKVGVFVDASPSEIISIVTKYHLNIVQLHGEQSEGFIIKLHNEIKLHALKNLEIWKVFSIDSTFDFTRLTSFENIVDAFLFDTKGKLKGGNGYSFNWRILKNYPSKKPFILSGGIGLDTLQNLREFKKLDISKYCQALDINSKFETKPGFKDIKSLHVFKSELTAIWKA